MSQTATTEHPLASLNVRACQWAIPPEPIIPNLIIVIPVLYFLKKNDGYFNISRPYLQYENQRNMKKETRGLTDLRLQAFT
jgi:hypothetical protein